MTEKTLSKGNAVLDERRAKGRDMRLRVHGADFVANTEANTDPFLKMYYDATEEFCWGSIWAREALSIKERSMLALCMTAAKGQQPAVAQHVRTALRAGWSRTEIGEILLHVYCYAGCYAALGAFHTAKGVFDQIDAGPDAAKEPVSPREPQELPIDPATSAWAKRQANAPSALAERGMQIRRELFGAADVDRWMERTVDDEFIMMFFDTTHEYCFGTLWARPALERRHRSMMSLAITASQNQHGAVHRHVRSCVTHGLSKEEIGEVLLQVYVYAGVYASLGAFQVAQEVFAALAKEGIHVHSRKGEASRI